ncbi:MAG TPA: hypothetical protein VK709_00275 [Candidatus Saccharimonadales bacterium]|jgi:hypothetical protein|nr:hypothetical protein [Candidatus Saccharimonadales bacterium]
MKHLYEIFEKFPDHSSLWRDSAMGARTAQQKAMDWARESANEFYAIDLTSGEVLRFNWNSGGEKPTAGSFKELQNKKQSSFIH